MTQRNNVCASEPLSKDRFQQRLAAAWGRVWPKLGSQPAMAAKMGLSDTSAIKRVTGMTHLPEAHTIFNSLLADETALNEVLAEYGFCLRRIKPEGANDLRTLSGLCETAAELSDALRDGRREHRETLKIADKLRPHMAALVGFIAEADELRATA